MSVDDLDKYEDDHWDQYMINCKKSDRIPYPVNAAQLIHQVPFPLSFKSIKSFNIASRMVHYYDSVSVHPTTANLR